MSLPRGKCSECGADVALRKNGVVREHSAPNRLLSQTAGRGVCKGAGKPPAAPGKVYQGIRKPGGLRVVVRTQDGEAPYRLQHHVRHSPTGFECGYAGSGPSDLARCILIDFLGDEAICAACDDGKIADESEGPQTCWECNGEVFKLPVDYQEFKFQVVAQLARDGFELTGEEVAEWVKEHRG